MGPEEWNTTTSLIIQEGTYESHKQHFKFKQNWICPNF